MLAHSDLGGEVGIKALFICYGLSQREDTLDHKGVDKGMEPKRVGDAKESSAAVSELRHDFGSLSVLL